MNILFLDQFSELGGAQHGLLDLVAAVVARGWKAHVAAPGDGPVAKRAVALGASFQSIRCGPYHAGRKSISDVARFCFDMRRLTRDIAGLPADLVYVNGPRPLPAVPPGRPVIFHCHSFLDKRYSVLLAGRTIRRTSATLIGACRFVLEPLVSYAAPERTFVVYNGVSGSPGEPRWPRAAQGDRPTIGLIGRVAPEKGHAELLRAARLLPGCRVMICGAPLFGAPEYLDDVHSLAAGLAVEFTGWQDDIPSVLARLDLLVVPSIVPEANPRVILEAFAAGVPVLASGTGGIPELIEHGRTGFLIESLAPAALAGQIRDLLLQPALVESVARNAHAAWRAHYTLAEYQRRILSIMETAGASARAWKTPREKTYDT